MSAQNWKEIGEREYTRLAEQFTPAQIRNILRYVEGEFVRQQLPPKAADAASEIVYELGKEFQPGAAIMILQAADRAAKKQMKENRTRKADAREQKPE